MLTKRARNLPVKILNHIANLALSEALFGVIAGRMKYTGRRGILGFLLEDISLFLVVLMGDRGDGNEGRIHTPDASGD